MAKEVVNISVCPNCKKNTGFTKSMFQFTITEDIECPHCYEVLIKVKENRSKSFRTERDEYDY